MSLGAIKTQIKRNKLLEDWEKGTEILIKDYSPLYPSNTEWWRIIAEYIDEIILKPKIDYYIHGNTLIGFYLD